MFKALSLTLTLFFAVSLTACEGNSDWRKTKANVLPQLVEGNFKNRLPIVFTDISRDLSIAYVVNSEESYVFIKTPQLKEWDISKETLHKVALKNLEKLSKGTDLSIATSEATGEAQYIIVEAEDAFSAVRMLSENVRSRVRMALGDEYVTAVPVRDFLIFWPKEFNLTGQFLEQVEKEYNNEQQFKLTPRPFLITPDGMVPLVKKAIAE